MEHELKIERNYLFHLVDGTKKSEIRFNDRDYQVGDTLKFHNILKSLPNGDPNFWLIFKITHIHTWLGLKDGYVCLSVEQIVT